MIQKGKQDSGSLNSLPSVTCRDQVSTCASWPQVTLASSCPSPSWAELLLGMGLLTGWWREKLILWCSSLNVEPRWRFLFKWFIGAAHGSGVRIKQGSWRESGVPLKTSLTPWSSGPSVAAQSQPLAEARGLVYQCYGLNCVPHPHPC